MGKRAIKQSTLIYVTGGITLLLAIAMMILALLVERKYDESVNANEIEIQSIQLGYDLLNASDLLTNEVRKYVQFGSKESYDNYWKEVNETKTMENVIKRLEDFDIPDDELDLVELAVKYSDELVVIEEQAMEAVAKGDFETARQLVYGEEYEEGLAKIEAAIEEFIQKMSKRVGDTADEIDERLNSYIDLMVTFVVVILGCAVFNIVFMFIKVIKPVIHLKNVMLAIAEGDLTQEIKTPVNTSEVGQLSGSIIKTRDSLKLLIEDTNMLVEAAAEGALDTRADTRHHKGDYLKIVEGVNKTLDTVIAPIKEAGYVLNLMAENDFTRKVEGNYKGQLLELANAINDVRSRLLSIEDVFIRVSNGDTSKLEEFEAAGKLSENDNLIPSAISMMRAIRGLVEEVEQITKECMAGNIRNARGNADAFKGGYKEILDGINGVLDVVTEPVTEAIKILEVMAVNDYTMTMSSKYKGDFAVLANSINEVRERLLHLQNTAIKIAQGDTSELENYRSIGKRSENDHLIPSFINMMETIKGLIDETNMLANEAAEGNLNVRGNAEKFKGDYVNVINGINSVIDAAATPMQEVKDVMVQISQGKLDVAVKGNYKGDFAVLTESVNETVSTLKNVISEISNNLLRIAQNDLDIEHVSEFRGDFAVISDSLNRIIGSLNRAMRDINSAAEQVAVGAGQISAASQTLSQGSEEQASSIEEVTATIAQMAAQVKQNAANATQADELSLAAKNSAIKGNEQMKEMLQAMHDINEASTNISKIIKVIDDIAFQTNILALNAAVEAARAGQYGKGFAVVAEEVRNLAQRSANAAKETTAMIEGSIEKVGIGMKIANNTAQGLYEIVESITKAAELVSQISYASNEQATAISQVNQAVEQVSQVVQTNSATAEETASASEELSSQAEILKDMVNKFRLREDLGTGLLNTDRMNPDILSAIEEMIDKRDRMQGKKETDVKPQKKTEKGSSKPKQTEGSKNKPQILLDDKEFGKY